MTTPNVHHLEFGFIPPPAQDALLSVYSMAMAMNEEESLNTGDFCYGLLSGLHTLLPADSVGPTRRLIESVIGILAVARQDPNREFAQIGRALVEGGGN